MNTFLDAGGEGMWGGADLTGEWGALRVREWEHGVGGLHREGKGTSLSAPLEGWNSSRTVPPIWQALVKTIPQLLVTLQIQLPFPLWREWEWEAIQIGRTEREKERRVFKWVGQMPRPVERLCYINILWRLSGSASSPSCVVLCLCVAAAAIAEAKWRTCEHARGKNSTFLFGDFPRCFGPKRNGKEWDE